MTVIEGLKVCRRCKEFPDFKYENKYISFDCPICKRSSSTHIVHGLEAAIEDWNRYHSELWDKR